MKKRIVVNIVLFSFLLVLLSLSFLLVLHLLLSLFFPFSLIITIRYRNCQSSAKEAVLEYKRPLSSRDNSWQAAATPLVLWQQGPGDE